MRVPVIDLDSLTRQATRAAIFITRLSREPRDQDRAGGRG